MSERPNPRECPGLIISASGVSWTDSLGNVHDLLKEALLHPGEIARRMSRSTEWVLRQIRANQLYPHVYFNSREIGVWAVAIDDFKTRALARQVGKGKRAA